MMLHVMKLSNSTKAWFHIIATMTRKAFSDLWLRPHGLQMITMIAATPRTSRTQNQKRQELLFFGANMAATNQSRALEIC